eukprot:TRINITY_DN857_c0_g1_i2.p1 TRINITY_DN857_c0_g1~~TRINITY_DN857_c0_g1_i2.p1  ORF type:complete len:190 (-),score=29.18 TRINITY_DN857_c0_g1_i2:15-584(-)
MKWILSEKRINLIMLSCSFLIMFIGQMVTSFLSDEGMEYMNFGYYGLLIVIVENVLYGIFSFPAAPIVDRYSSKRGILFGALLNIASIFLYIIPVACFAGFSTSGFCSRGLCGIFLMIASLLGGAGVSTMWVATQTYIRECSTEGTVHENQGIFFTITNVSTIIANWMAIILFQTKGLRVGLYLSLIHL